VLAAVSTTFWRVLASQLVLDDPYLTVKNPYVQSLAGLARIVSTDIMGASALEETSGYYRPVAMASFLVNRLVTGNSAASYHAGNLLLHAVNALLLGIVLARSSPARRGAAILAPALLFAVAPINVEAVAWISCRFDLLGATFALAALAVNAGSGARARAGAAILVAASLFCKESFIVAPLLVYLEDALVLRRAHRWRAEAPKYAGMAVAVTVMFLARWGVGVPSASVAASTGVGAMVRCYAFLLTTFARALVYPAYLDPFRVYAPPAAWSAALVVAAAVAACGAAVAAIRLRPDDMRAREALFGLAWILISLSPTSLTGPNLDMVGERYAYFPFIGAFIALAPLVDAAWARARGAAPHAATAAAGLLIVGVVGSAWRAGARVRDWATETTLEEASLRDDPDNPYALERLGGRDALEGRFESATALLTRSLAKSPGNARALTALCYVHLKERQPAVAEGECERSVAIDPGDPRAFINLAGARVNQRKWPSGLDAATRAVALKPRSAEARYLRAACLANLGALAEARDELRVALEIDPGHEGANSLLRQFRARGIP
jgi:protein O-mannosyl-transferase